MKGFLIDPGKAMSEYLENGGGRHRSRWRTFVWGAAALLLLLPLFAMQVTDQVDWGVADFAIFGAMLVGAGGTYEFAARKRGDPAYRAAVGVALAAAFVLVWMNLAVGVIGAEENPANMLYSGVLAVGIIGSIIARFQPRGMARAMVTTALAQVFVAMIAVTAGLGSAGPDWLGQILILTGFFTALWLVSAWLFRRAARVGRPSPHRPHTLTESPERTR
jgi:hypothetical protein